jgi:hypothetical protein
MREQHAKGQKIVLPAKIASIVIIVKDERTCGVCKKR